jgi:Zn-dependent protease with chaperone function
VIALLLVLMLALACAPASVLPLVSGRWQVWHPRLALALWLGIGTGGLALAALSVLTAAVLVAVSGPADGIARGLALVLVAWLGLGGAGVLAAIALGAGGPSPSSPSADEEAASAAPVRRAHPATLRMAWDLELGAVLYEVDDPGLIAHAVGGKHPEIVLSRQAREALTPAELRGVLAHEAAHLRGHHARLRALCAWHAACLPRRSALRRLLVTRVHLLTELAADDAAARAVGAERLRAGLQAAHTLLPSPALVVRAERLAARAPQTPSGRTRGRGVTSAPAPLPDSSGNVYTK